jgi:hypothetical protein
MDAPIEGLITLGNRAVHAREPRRQKIWRRCNLPGVSSWICEDSSLGFSPPLVPIHERRHRNSMHHDGNGNRGQSNRDQVRCQILW